MRDMREGEGEGVGVTEEEEEEERERERERSRGSEGDSNQNLPCSSTPSISVELYQRTSRAPTAVTHTPPPPIISSQYRHAQTALTSGTSPAIFRIWRATSILIPAIRSLNDWNYTFTGEIHRI